MMLENPSLLITDDDRDYRETLQEVFAPRGFRTLLAANGEEAVKIVRHNLIHLAVFDLHMPKLNGLDAVRQIKRNHQALPCILMSAALDEGVEREAKDIDVLAVLRKPVSFRDLTSLVTDIMKRMYNWPEPGEQGRPAEG